MGFLTFFNTLCVTIGTQFVLLVSDYKATLFHIKNLTIMNIKTLSSFAVFGFLGGVAAFAAINYFSTNTPQQVVNIEQIPHPHQFAQMMSNPSVIDEQTMEDGFVAASEKTIHAVVHVTTQFTPNYKVDPFMEFFWGGRVEAQPQTASGSGVIISEDGYIVTNNHVIDNADKIEITLNNKQSFEAKVVGTDPSTDLALLKVDAKQLPSIAFGNSDHVKIGQWVLAVGNPFNLTSTVTAGIVSAKARNINILKGDPNRDIFPLEAFIQTDAAVNPGNSGGALVDIKGNLVGINTAIASRTGSYTGYSFAVPSNIVNKVTKDLLEFGVVQRAFMGVVIEDVNQAKANDLKLDNVAGVFVREAVEGGSAYEAGIKNGDVITKIGDVAVNNVPELQEQIAKYRPGDKVLVSYKRSNKEQTAAITLKDKQGNASLAKNSTAPKQTQALLGAVFKDLSNEEKSKYKTSGGAKITSITSGKLKSAGVEQGFIVKKVNQEEITSAQHLTEVLSKTKGGVLIEGMYPNGTTAYYGFGL
jgi:serine protease Do